MANIPIMNPPDKEHLGFCWHHQFTIPLLFDDCLSLLQKVCALWAKLNDVIDALNVFNNEFNTWAKSVEESLKDLYAKYEALDTRVTNIEEQLQNIQTELNNIKNDITNINQRLDNIENRMSNIENEITDIKQSITDINNSITQIQADITELEARVKKLEDLLKNLNIIPPIDIYNATDEEFKTGLWQNWWNWLKPRLYFVESDIANGWEYSSNVVWWDTTTRLPRYFQLGRVTQPITLCKLPFVAVRKNTFDHEPTIEDLRMVSPRYNNEAFTAGNGFFDFPLTSPFGFTMDEIKFQTSYIPFLPTNSTLYYSRTGGFIDSIKNINCGVRLQVPITGTSAKLSVTSDMLIMGACPNSVPITDNTKWDMYIYAVAENG
jgi:archaellum component FlaC